MTLETHLKNKMRAYSRVGYDVADIRDWTEEWKMKNAIKYINSFTPKEWAIKILEGKKQAAADWVKFATQLPTYND